MRFSKKIGVLFAIAAVMVSSIPDVHAKEL
jgi:hypothetical protein